MSIGLKTWSLSPWIWLYACLFDRAGAVRGRPFSRSVPAWWSLLFLLSSWLGPQSEIRRASAKCDPHERLHLIKHCVQPEAPPAVASVMVEGLLFAHCALSHSPRHSTGSKDFLKLCCLEERLWRTAWMLTRFECEDMWSPSCNLIRKLSLPFQLEIRKSLNWEDKGKRRQEETSQFGSPLIFVLFIIGWTSKSFYNVLICWMWGNH